MSFRARFCDFVAVPCQNGKLRHILRIKEVGAIHNMIKIFAAMALAMLCANCATVTRGTTSQVQIYSDPPGADVATSLGHRCTTPCTLTIDRKSEFTVSMSKAGFKPVQIPVRAQVAGAGAAGFAGNIILGGVVGMVADAATGATLEHVPNPVSSTLEAIMPATRGNRRGKPPEPRAVTKPQSELPPIPEAPEPLVPAAQPVS